MRKLIAIALFALFSQASVADWTLNNEASTFNFLSTKKNSVTEIHTFKQLGGSINKEGRAEVKIQLASVETNIPIRNERVRNLLFQITKYETATATLRVNPDLLYDTHAGKHSIVQLPVIVNLHGLSKELSAELVVTVLEKGTLQVHSLKPLLLKAADFDLTNGINQLRMIAKLNSINTTVPVTFTLIFTKD